jgi:hypothetical protein
MRTVVAFTMFFVFFLVSLGEAQDDIRIVVPNICPHPEQQMPLLSDPECDSIKSHANYNTKPFLDLF